MKTPNQNQQATETEAEVYRMAGESEAAWLSRLAIRDMVRKAAWLKTWQVVTLDGHHTIEASEVR